MTLRSLILYLHVLAAMFWVGEMLFMSLVLGPLSRKLYDPLKRAELFRSIGQRSRPWIWLAMLLLVLTGLGNLWLIGIPFSSLFLPVFYESRFGRVLAIKLLFVVLLISLTLLHDFGAMRYGTAVRRRLADQAVPEGEGAMPAMAKGGHMQATSAESDPVMARYRAFGLWMGRVSLLLGLVIVYLGVTLLNI